MYNKYNLFNITKFFLSEFSIHVFNHCTVAIFRFNDLDLTEATNETRLKLVVLVLPSNLPSGSRAAFGHRSVQPVQSFNNKVNSIIP